MVKLITVYLMYCDCADTLLGSSYGWYLRLNTNAKWRGPYTSEEVKILQLERGVTCQFVKIDGIHSIEGVIASANNLLVD